MGWAGDGRFFFLPLIPASVGDGIFMLPTWRQVKSLTCAAIDSQYADDIARFLTELWLNQRSSLALSRGMVSMWIAPHPTWYVLHLEK